MITQANNIYDTIIIGGGIAGLSTAWYLQKQKITNYTILESSDYWGGKVKSTHVDIGKEQSIIIESGPDGFLTRKPWALELANELGLSNAIIPVNNLPKRIYVWSNKCLIPLPDGLYLLVPTKLMPFLRSPLFSWQGKIRLLLERFIPAKLDNNDETLAEFITRRLGKEALDKLGEPLLAGVYNADSHKQSILATFPNFRKLEAQYGNLIGGMINTKKNKPPSTNPMLISFKKGMGEFPQALVKQLKGDLQLNTSVISINKNDGIYTVHLSNGNTLRSYSVVMTTPANITTKLLTDNYPTLASKFAEIRYEGIGNITLAYRKQDINHTMDAFGVVIPKSENRQIDGITWISNKWDHRAPNDIALVRAFFGGPHSRHMLDKDDDTILETVAKELHEIMGLDAQPIHHHITRWHKAYPQYDLGHIKRIQVIKNTLPDGMYIAGNAYHGVGLPDTIRFTKETATTLFQQLKQAEIERV